jgi:hypothetical protein
LSPRNVVPDQRDDRRQLIHGDGLRGDFLQQLRILGFGLLFPASALVLHERFEAAQAL